MSQIAAPAGISLEDVHESLTKHIKLSTIFTLQVPHLLTEEQKVQWVNCNKDLLSVNIKGCKREFQNDQSRENEL